MSDDLKRTLSHEHKQLDAIDRLNFPSNTESGGYTDEYITSTQKGFIPAAEEDLDAHTIIGSSAVEKKPSYGSDPEKGVSVEDIKLVTWKVDDSEDPKNWGKGIKWIRTFVAALQCLAVALGSSIIVMDMPDVADALNTNLDVVHLTVTLFVFGFGIGPLFFAPLSEMYGRRPIFMISMGGYFVFTFPSAFAKNAASLVMGRLLAGISASAPMTVIGGTIADMWSAEERGMPMAIFSATVFMGPIFGPVIAGFLSATGWRSNYYLLIGVVGLAWISVVALLPETYAPVLLRRRAEKMRKETGDQGFMTEQERLKKPIAEVMKTALIRPLYVLVTEPIIFLITLYLSLIYALLYLFFFAFPIIFGNLHNFSLGMIGLSFLSILIGMLIVFFTVMPWQNKHYARITAECKEKGVAVPPESRLPAMIIGAFILPIGLFIFAFTSYKHVHWIGPMIGGALFGFGMIAIYIGANTYVVDSFPSIAASAMASKTFMSRLCGGAIPMFVDRFYDSKLGVVYASLVIALIATIMIPIPVGFYFYGAKVRGMSKNAAKI